MAINNTTISRTELLEALYIKAFPAVARYVAKRRGSPDEAKDVFHDALIVYMEHIQNGREVPGNEQAYIMGISKHLWSKRFDEVTKMYNGDIQFTDTDYTEAAIPKLMHLLSTTGKKCMDLLSAFYYEKLDAEKLAQRFGFSGSRSATVQKHKCLEKVKETVKQKSLQYEDFME